MTATLPAAFSAGLILAARPRRYCTENVVTVTGSPEKASTARCAAGAHGGAGEAP